MEREKRKNARRTGAVSLLLALVALAAATAVTAAWFVISDHARVYSLGLDVTTGLSLRFDLDAHETFAAYRSTLTVGEIFERIRRESGFDPEKTPLKPVTTADARTFTFRSGKEPAPSEGAYLRFTLHFMASEDMLVHLSSANSAAGAGDGTHVDSRTPGLSAAMRISFAGAEGTAVYDPGGTAAGSGQGLRSFGLPPAALMTYSDENALFFAKANTDIPIEVCIWMEGTDPACTDAVKNGDFAIRLRFVGTDADNNTL